MDATSPPRRSTRAASGSRQGTPSQSTDGGARGLSATPGRRASARLGAAAGAAATTPASAHTTPTTAPPLAPPAPWGVAADRFVALPEAGGGATGGVTKEGEGPAAQAPPLLSLWSAWVAGGAPTTAAATDDATATAATPSPSRTPAADTDVTDAALAAALPLPPTPALADHASRWKALAARRGEVGKPGRDARAARLGLARLLAGVQG